jgi:hypothetical protein
MTILWEFDEKHPKQVSAHRRLTANWYLNGNCFQLRQVIQIMACDGFNEFAERHLSTLRMQ